MRALHRIIVALSLLALLWPTGASAEPSRAAPRASAAAPARETRSSRPLRRLRARWRLGARRLRHAAARFKRSRAGRVLRRARRLLRRAGTHATARLTAAVDALQRKLPPRAARLLERARVANPLAFAAFAAHKFEQDRAFLAAYGAFSMGFSNLQLPILIAAGVDPISAGAIRVLTGTPVDLGVLLWRQHALRRDKSQHLGDTVRGLLREYRDFARRRRRRNRRAWRRLRGRTGHRQPARIQALGAALAR